jgi:hypothetical protein
MLTDTRTAGVRLLSVDTPPKKNMGARPRGAIHNTVIMCVKIVLIGSDRIDFNKIHQSCERCVAVEEEPAINSIFVTLRAVPEPTLILLHLPLIP